MIKQTTTQVLIPELASPHHSMQVYVTPDNKVGVCPAHTLDGAVNLTLHQATELRKELDKAITIATNASGLDRLMGVEGDDDGIGITLICSDNSPDYISLSWDDAVLLGEHISELCLIKDTK